MITFSQLGNLGRAGNMNFQMAATIGLAIKNKDKYVFPNWIYEPHFNLHGCFSNNIKITKEYREPFFHYQEIPHKNTTNEVLNITGYFQSSMYWDHCQDLIRHFFTPIVDFQVQENTTAIHVRRGDYLKYVKEHGVLDMNYYKTAMDIIKSKHYLIFSDDIGWCKQNFIGSQFSFSEGRSPPDDLKLMSKCTNQIIANSSFSWWGAWLNINSNKMVVAPKKWFGEILGHDTKDLLPNEWVKI